MNIDARVLARDFPDISDMRNGMINDTIPLKGYDQGDIELYSNFGFTYGQ